MKGSSILIDAMANVSINPPVGICVCVPAINETNALREALRQRVGKFLLKSRFTLCKEFCNLFLKVPFVGPLQCFNSADKPIKEMCLI